jgi:LPS sulfotransferase NodH
MSINRNGIQNLIWPGRRSDGEAAVWERIVERNRHEREIAKLYGVQMRPLPGQPHTERLIVILTFTNRSGSNFLCNCLSATGKFEDAGEAFNWEIVANRSARRGISSFSDYCLHHVGNIGDPRKHVVVKAGIRQLVMLWKHGIVGPEGLFRNTKYVRIERRDLLAQAVSYSIAFQTRQFNSLQGKKELMPEFDARDIQKRLAAIVQQNAMATEFFSSLNLPVLRVVYETLLSNRSRVLDRLTEFLGLEALLVDEAEITLERQRTEINEQFEIRFKELMTEKLSEWSRP